MEGAFGIANGREIYIKLSRIESIGIEIFLIKMGPESIRYSCLLSPHLNFEQAKRQ